jgi:hypothetical protein
MSDKTRARQALLLALVTPTLACATTFNAKPGAWESTTTSVMSGSLLPAAELAKLPAAQRAKLEAMMAAQSGHARTMVHKSCITQADLDQNRLLKSDGEEHCKTRVVTSSPIKLVLDRECPPPHANTAHVVIEARSPENYVGHIDVSIADGGQMHLDIQGRWLGASCAGLKPGE